MKEEIVNRVTKSNLITINLEDFYPLGERVIFDISNWLEQGFILKEMNFREKVLNHDWNQYRDKFVAISCTSDAIIPSWAYLLIATKLSPVAKKIVVGNLELLETVIFQDIISGLDTTMYIDKPIIIKGCSNKPIPETASVHLIEKLLPIAKNIMFGEACSTVPLYKRKK